MTKALNDDLVEEVKENEAKMEALENKNRKNNNSIALHIIQNQICAPKSSAGVDWRLSGWSSVRRPMTEDPIGASGIDTLMTQHSRQSNITIS